MADVQGILSGACEVLEILQRFTGRRKVDCADIVSPLPDAYLQHNKDNFVKRMIYFNHFKLFYKNITNINHIYKVS